MPENFMFLGSGYLSISKMRWEKLQIQSTVGEGCGPGKRWGHTCNPIRGGKLLYVFGGYGKDECRTNQVHVLDTGDSLQAILGFESIQSFAYRL
ncbi:unnamed protein product [Camellia sinensis]